MQSILLKLNDPKLSKEEILEIATNTKRHDVLLQVMKTYPEREELILILAEQRLTVTDYEYAKYRLSPGLVSKLKDIIFEKMLSLRSTGRSLRDVYGPDHPMTKSMEGGMEYLGDAIEKYNNYEYKSPLEVEDIFGYMRGTIQGARDVIEIMNDHPQWGDIYPSIYDDGDMLDHVLIKTKDLDLAYKIARRIDPENLDNRSLGFAKSYYPYEYELHEIIEKKTIKK